MRIQHARIAIVFLVSMMMLGTTSCDGSARLNAVDLSIEEASTSWHQHLLSQAHASRTGDSSDESREVVGPDANLHVSVAKPIASGKGRILLEPPHSNTDAGLVINQAIERARVEGIDTISFKPGVYNIFPSRRNNSEAHIFVNNVTDLVIEGNGAILQFHGSADGLLMKGSRRVLVESLGVRYANALSTIGKVVKTSISGDQAVLKFQSPASPKVYYLMRYNPVGRKWGERDDRVIAQPGNYFTLAPEGQLHTGKRLRTAVGNQYIAYHHWYAGSAVRIEGDYGVNASEDITLSRVTINSAPGFGIFVYGLNRGFALLNSTVASDHSSSNPYVSALYDGIHIMGIGGDVIIDGNSIKDTGDDAINIASPVIEVESRPSSGYDFVLGKYSRFLRRGDIVHGFDSDGAYLGKYLIASSPKKLTPYNHNVRIEKPSGYETTATKPLAFFRPDKMTGSRFIITNNNISNCNCHAALIQVSNGSFEKNHITDINRNPIRVTTDTYQWNEGSSVTNVVISDNYATMDGKEVVDNEVLGAISIYARTRNGITHHPIHGSISVQNNKIIGGAGPCILKKSASRILDFGNSCIDRAN